ncbi:EF-hand domain-containing protein [Brevifollis gellanilyticus]|uniref:SPARC/Testican calcium-binding domain-containing protein n=1 Tax=Brevifollis gellanilyticus TaxID=748831 RepID=A0A512M3M4_9BACT|nr:EF-hand domain-containing protein [Brevifollis gellanilyticus]GEP41332.1 hypothetical protein BGE01nite_06230 [Brevifollis gellanilyticus]
MKRTLTTMAALLALTLTAAAQSGGSGTSRVGGIPGSSNVDTNTAGGSLNVANPDQRQTFAELDSNKDDILSKEELSRMRGDNDANKLLIQKSDLNSDGSLSKDEFASLPANDRNAANAQSNSNNADARNNDSKKPDAQNNRPDARSNNDNRENNSNKDKNTNAKPDTQNSSKPNSGAAGSPGATTSGNGGQVPSPN